MSPVINSLPVIADDGVIVPNDPPIDPDVKFPPVATSVFNANLSSAAVLVYLLLSCVCIELDTPLTYSSSEAVVDNPANLLISDTLAVISDPPIWSLVAFTSPLAPYITALLLTTDPALDPSTKFNSFALDDTWTAFPDVPKYNEVVLILSIWRLLSNTTALLAAEVPAVTPLIVAAVLSFSSLSPIILLDLIGTYDGILTCPDVVPSSLVFIAAKWSFDSSHIKPALVSLPLFIINPESTYQLLQTMIIPLMDLVPLHFVY